MRFALSWRLPTLAVVALVAGALVLAGCGTPTTTTGTSPTATTAPTAAPTATTAPTNTPSGPTAAVTIMGGAGAYKFSPSTMSIKVGTTVTWTNNTSAPHTVTSDAGDPASINGSLGDSGATFSFTFTTPGTYKYHCSVHPYMTATITVTM